MQQTEINESEGVEMGWMDGHRERERERSGVERIRRDRPSGGWMGTPPRPASCLCAQSSDTQLRRKSNIVSSDDGREERCLCLLRMNL